MNKTVMFLTLGQWIGLAVILTGTVGEPVVVEYNHNDIDSNVVADPIKYTANINVQEDTTLSQRLWADSLEIAEKALDTPFIQGLKDGTLLPTKFGAYIVQDAVYLEKQSDILMIASQNVATNDAVVDKEFLIGQSIKYMGYAIGMYKDWHLTNSSCVKLGSGCQAYTDYKFGVAKTMEPIYTIVAMIPCLKLWPWIGKEFQKLEHNSGVYTSWVEGNFDPTYVGYEKFDEIVDTYYAKGLITEEIAKEVYRNCMNGEYLFFDRAMN